MIEMNIEKQIFKKCPMCGLIWNTRHNMLSDPLVKLTGYVVNLKEPELGIFTFNHISCQGTFAAKASFFTDFLHGENFDTSLTGDGNRTQYGLSESELKSCPQQYEISYFRDMIQHMKEFSITNKKELAVF